MNRDGIGIRDNSLRLFFVWPKRTKDRKGVRNRETLTVNGKPVAPNPTGIAYARKVKAKLDRAIELDTFVMADFFPDSKKAGPKGASTATFADFCATWLDTRGRLALKTRTQYRNASEVWKRLLGAEKPIAEMSHGYVAAKVGSHPWASNKLLNNYLIVLRGVFALAGRELKLTDNPTDGIENGKHQKPAPDPLSGDEAAKIIADLKKHHPVQVWAYFQFAFATGLRPEETIALRWSDVDWNEKTIRVERARSSGKIGPLKTYMQRDVDLVDESIGALKAMKPITFLADAEIFQNPVTRRPWHDERSQRDHYWKASLRRCGIRYRKPYNTRHTYATEALMGGVNPNYVYRQMGHKNAKMLFEIYSKWIDKADRGRERDKLEAAHRNRRAG